MSPKFLLVCGLFVASYLSKGADSSCAAPCGACFKDNPKDRALPYYAGSVKSPRLCMDKCGAKNYEFAGVQNGFGCYCGTDYAKYGRANNCNKKCAWAQVCGGWNANTVWPTGKKSLSQKIKDKAVEKAKDKAKDKAEDVIKDKAKEKFEKSGAKDAAKKVGRRIFKVIRRHFW